MTEARDGFFQLNRDAEEQVKFHVFILAEARHAVYHSELRFRDALKIAVNDQFDIFHGFGKLPTELRFMIWKSYFSVGGPRIVPWGEDRVPAASKACQEAHELYERDCKYFEMKGGYRVKIHVQQFDVIFFRDYVPGLKIYASDSWKLSRAIQMT